MASQEVYQIQAAGGAGSITFFADGLPEECSCEPGSGRIMCKDTLEKGSYSFYAYVRDSAGKESDSAKVSFQMLGDTYSEFISLVGDTLRVTFDGVALCPGACESSHDYITYDLIDPSFINGRSFELTKNSGLSSSDPEVGAVWEYQDPEPFIIKKIGSASSCNIDPYGLSPTEETISLDIQAKLRDAGNIYEFEIYVNRDEDGGIIFDGRYDISDPYQQIPNKVFGNINLDCDENAATHGATVIATGGTATFSAFVPCVNTLDE